MIKIRQLGRREVERGGLLSEEPEWRRVQLRILGIALFFAASFAWLAHRKLTRLYGVVPVGVGEGLIVAAVIAFVVRQVVSARRPKVEPRDVDLDLAVSQVQEQLAVGTLRPMDLVHERGAWTTLHESVQFSEAAEPAQQRAHAKERALMGVMIAGGLVAAAVAGLVFLNLGDLLMWLSTD